MRIFFDTEFTGLHKNTTLISIGLVARNGKRFYGGLLDYDKSQVNEWIQKYVVDHMFLEKIDGVDCYYGNKEEISKRLKEWLSQFGTIEWISDVCHYDFVLLIDLLYGHALDIPYGVHGASCHDLNQDIARHYWINEIEAFDKSREQILRDICAEVEGVKHNALYDAMVIKEIYESIYC